MSALSTQRFFIHYVPQGDFDRGIFVPFASLDEAERQATWELMHGADPEIFAGIFQARQPQMPKAGWLRIQMDGPPEELAPHLDPQKRKPVHDLQSLLKQAKILAPRIEEENKRAQEEFYLQIRDQIRAGLDQENSVPGNAYTWCTGGTATATPAALSASTAKTVLLILAAAANQPSIAEFGVSFDGVTASAVPALVELTTGTAGGAGTPRTTLAAGHQIRGWPAQTSQTTAGDTYSGEPTTELVAKKWYVSPNGGLFVVQSPLGREPTGLVTAATDGHTWGVRVTASATVNCHAYIEFEE